MIDHMTIPVSNLEKSRDFYEKAFLPLGFKVSFGKEGNFWAFDLAGRGLFEIRQENNPFTKIHVAFRVQTRESVHGFHISAMQAGATDNGGAGPRPDYTPNYYACFVFDPDGHNIEAVHDKWQSEK
jgi:catechol 2,3-dioxygenase-like lactoylglutathione lyase family enzyme